MENQDQIQEILQGLLGSIGIEANCEFLSATKTIEIGTVDQALLIGKHGENLRALQHVFNMIRRRKFPESEFVTIDIAGYKAQRVEKVQQITKELASKVLETGEPQTLPTMNSFERRQAHMVVADMPELITESVGMDPHRTIVIKKRD